MYLLNMVGVLLTLGLYSFWAKVRVRRALFSQPEFWEPPAARAMATIVPVPVSPEDPRRHATSMGRPARRMMAGP